MRALKIIAAMTAIQLAIWGGLAASGCLESLAVRAGRARVAWSRTVHAELVASYGLGDEQASEVMELVVCTESDGYSWQWRPAE